MCPTETLPTGTDPLRSLPLAPGPAALQHLTPSQLSFLHTLPHRAELHAHLNGSIPVETLRELAARRRDRRAFPGEESLPLVGEGEAVESGLRRLEDGVVLEEIGDFFGLFPSIYALTSTPTAIYHATLSVLRLFLSPPPNSTASADATHLDLRTTPRAVSTTHVTREDYLRAVLHAMADFARDELGGDASRVGLIVSVDRRMSAADADEIVALAVKLKEEGERVMGVDLCGDMTTGNDVRQLLPALARVKAAGLGLTMHLYETAPQTPDEEQIEYELLTLCRPDRLGHATFLSPRALEVVLEKRICLELCLSSNLLCKTVKNLESHHIVQHLLHGTPIAICTDDPLPFRTSLIAEYALLLAPAPHGLGLSEEAVRRIAEGAWEGRFS